MADNDSGEWDLKLSPEDELEVARLQKEILHSVPIVRAFLERLGITHEELAEVLGVTQSNVSKMEAKPEPRWDALRTLIEHKGGKMKLVVDFDGDQLEWPFGPAPGVAES